MSLVKDTRALDNQAWHVGKQSFVRRKLTQSSTPRSIAVWIVGGLIVVAAAVVVLWNEPRAHVFWLATVFIGFVYVAACLMLLSTKSQVMPASDNNRLYHLEIDPLYRIVLVKEVKENWQRAGVKPLIDEMFELYREEAARFDDRNAWLADPDAGDTKQRLRELAKQIGKKCGAGNKVLDNFAEHVRSHLYALQADLLQQIAAAEKSGDTDHAASLTERARYLERKLIMPPLMRHSSSYVE